MYDGERVRVVQSPFTDTPHPVVFMLSDDIDPYIYDPSYGLRH